MRQIRQNVINKFEILIVCLRNRHCRNPQSHDFFSCYDKVFDVKCQLAFYHKVLWKTELKQMGKKIGVHMPTIHRFTCQTFTDAIVLNVYPQFRDRSLFTTWGGWGEEFGRFWSRCRAKNLPDIPKTGFIIFLWFPSHCHLIDNQFSVVLPLPFYTMLTTTDPHQVAPPWINEDCEDWSPYVTKFSDECFSVHLFDPRAS